MRVVTEAEAAERWFGMLDEVERGEVFVITRDGRPVAELARVAGEAP